jgi:hypothetical protein
MTIIPALRKLRQENCEFEASLSYTVPGQPGPHSKTLPQQNNNKCKTNKQKMMQDGGRRRGFWYLF